MTNKIYNFFLGLIVLFVLFPQFANAQWNDAWVSKRKYQLMLN